MFILYAVLAGIVGGLATSGRLERLADLHLAWVWLAATGFLVQFLLFSTPLGDQVGTAGPPVYVISTIAVALFVLRNVRVAGFPVVLLGGLLNLAAIVANGGYMPANHEALVAAGLAIKGTYSNSVSVANPVLAPLTDIFALPAGLPFANVFSVGDVLIGVGAFVAVVIAMRSDPGPEGAPA